MRALLVLTALTAFFSLPLSTAQALLAPGDIVFTLYDAENGTDEGNDQFAFVALTDIPGEEQIFFNDEEWSYDSESTEGSFSDTEGTVLWTAPVEGVAAGTVVNFNLNNSAVRTVSLGDLVSVDGVLNIANNGETVWAYQGELGVPSSFLSVISSEGFLNTLEGTGLTEGVNAIGLNAGFEHAQYIGPRAGEGSIPDYLPLIAGDIANNWFQENNPSGVDYLADLTPFTVSKPGDFNGDTLVDAADYAVWRNNLGEDEGVLMGGGDGLDGVDMKDYDIWRAHFGAAPAPVAAANTTPEPTAVVIAVAALAALAPMRLKRGY